MAASTGRITRLASLDVPHCQSFLTCPMISGVM
jgi:hypothetical protein